MGEVLREALQRFREIAEIDVRLHPRGVVPDVQPPSLGGLLTVVEYLENPVRDPPGRVPRWFRHPVADGPQEAARRVDAMPEIVVVLLESQPVRRDRGREPIRLGAAPSVDVALL